MRVNYNYKEYKNSPRATLLSKIVGIITSIVLMLSGLFGFAFICMLYEGVVEHDWDHTLWWCAVIFALCIAVVVFIDKVVTPAIEKIARKDDERVAKGLKRPWDF